MLIPLTVAYYRRRFPGSQVDSSGGVKLVLRLAKRSLAVGQPAHQHDGDVRSSGDQTEGSFLLCSLLASRVAYQRTQRVLFASPTGSA